MLHRDADVFEIQEVNKDTPFYRAVKQESLENMRSCAEDITGLTRFDTMFHMEIAKASGNHLLMHTMENAKDAFNDGIFRAFQVDTRENVAEALMPP